MWQESMLTKYFDMDQGAGAHNLMNLSINVG